MKGVEKIYLHEGVDLLAPPGASVRSPVNGTVENIGDVYGNGRFNSIWIRTMSGHRVRMFYVTPHDGSGNHLVKPGALVNAGQAVGTMQDRAKGIKGMDNHLHLQIEKHGVVLNPAPWLKKWGVK